MKTKSNHETTKLFRFLPPWVAVLISAISLWFGSKSLDIAQAAFLQSQAPAVQVELLSANQHGFADGKDRVCVRNLSSFPLIDVESRVIGYVVDVPQQKIVYRKALLLDPLKTTVLEPGRDYFVTAEELSTNLSDSALFHDHPATETQTNFRALVVTYYRKVDHRRFVKTEPLHIYFGEEFRSADGQSRGKGVLLVPAFQESKGVSTSRPEPQNILNIVKHVEWVKKIINRADE